MRPDIVLKLDRQTFSGWSVVRVRRGIEQLAGTFDLQVVDKWALDGSARQIQDGMACQVLIGGQPVITGWVDDVSAVYDGTSHSLQVRGRDKTGDLVDCSAIHATQEWVGRTLTQVAEDLCAPFGIAVQARADVGGPFLYTHAEQGESVHDLIDRAARLRGVLAISDAATGDLVLTRAGDSRAVTPLALGDNILAGRSHRSQRDRFSLYRVVGQQRESDTLSPQAAATPSAQVGDPGVERYRPLVVPADSAADISECQTRARWERSNRAAQGQRAAVTVVGWLDDGAPWTPNTLVRVTDRWLGLDGDYLIAAVEYSIDDDAGAITRLTVVPPAAYDVLAQKETDPAGASGGIGAVGTAGGITFGEGSAA